MLLLSKENKLEQNHLKDINSHFEAIVIGGGIVGAGILRDLSLNNIQTLLVEKKILLLKHLLKVQKCFMEEYDIWRIWTLLLYSKHYMKKIYG